MRGYLRQRTKFSTQRTMSKLKRCLVARPYLQIGERCLTSDFQTYYSRHRLQELLCHPVCSLYILLIDSLFVNPKSRLLFTPAFDLFGLPLSESFSELLFVVNSGLSHNWFNLARRTNIMASFCYYLVHFLHNKNKTNAGRKINNPYNKYQIIFWLGLCKSGNLWYLLFDIVYVLLRWIENHKRQQIDIDFIKKNCFID